MLKTMAAFTFDHLNDEQGETESSPELIEFQEILYNEEDEICGDIDIEKLRLSARRGIPDEIRGDVWKILLVPSSSMRSSPITAFDPSQPPGSPLSNSSCSFNSSSGSRSCCEMFQVKRLRGEIARYRRKLSASGVAVDRLEIVEHVLESYLGQNPSHEFSPSLVHLCVPVVYASRSEEDCYMSFEALMKHIEEYYSRRRIEERVGHFYSLLRMLMPDLYDHLEEEEVSRDCFTSWLQYLLSKELPLHCVMRLWDCYFSLENGLDLHQYVCLSLLFRCRETMEELENSEIQSFLCRLPSFDMDELIHQAQNLKYEIEQMNLY